MKEYIMRYENEVLQLLPDKIQPLVRCKDCISFYKNDNMINTNAQKGMQCKASSIDPDWFCADGKRKEGR